MKNWFLILAVILLAIGCKQADSTKQAYPSFVDPSKNNNWGGDVRLLITEIVKTDSSTLYTLKSVYDHDTLGFKLSLPNQTEKSGSGAGLKIFSLGRISKNFKNALASVYKIKVDTSKDFPAKINVSFVDLDKFAISVTGQEATDKNGFNDYKLFFEDAKNSEDGEAQVFVNINEADKILQLQEKDSEYRKAIIGFFTK
jgi:hypothetical protein